MLPAPHRLRRRDDFTRALRRGRRAGGALLAVHLVSPEAEGPEGDDAPARVGFVVSRAVGPAVTRTRVKRRLRHVAAARLGRLAPGSVLVVRALPAARAASSLELGTDFDRVLDRVLGLEQPGLAHAGGAR